MLASLPGLHAVHAAFLGTSRVTSCPSDSRWDDPLCGRPYVDKTVLAEALGDDPPPVARIAKEARPPRDPTLPSPAEMRKLAAREKKVCSLSTQHRIDLMRASTLIPVRCARTADKAAFTRTAGAQCLERGS